MVFLLLSVFFSSILFVIFQYFEKYRIHNFSAITVNYLIAYLVGSLLNQQISFDFFSKPWGWSAGALGFLFISLFGVLAKVTQERGITTSVVANKMSMIIPIICAFIVLGDTPNWIKYLGILLSIPGIILTVMKKEHLGLKAFWGLPLILFLGSGILDFSLKLNETYLVPASDFFPFVSSIFLSAFIVGLIYGLAVKGIEWNWRNLIAGAFLGIPNYFSIYFLMKALNSGGLQSSVVFPINNSGILIFSTILSVVIFSEKLSFKNWLGIIFCLLSIAMIYIS